MESMYCLWHFYIDYKVIYNDIHISLKLITMSFQMISEIQNPIHVELSGVLSGKRGMICGSVCSEFKELVSMCGGPNEKSRAGYLLKWLL